MLVGNHSPVERVVQLLLCGLLIGPNSLMTIDLIKVSSNCLMS